MTLLTCLSINILSPTEGSGTLPSSGNTIVSKTNRAMFVQNLKDSEVNV